MSLLLDGTPSVLGVQQPRVYSCPPYETTTGLRAIELAAKAGLYLDEWQQLELIDALGRRADQKWAAFEVGVVVSRQNGKGSLLEARELAGLYLLEERLIIHSAHQFDTSIEAFRRLVDLIESSSVFTKRIRRVSNSHGSEGIELKSGQRIRFRTRTKGGGRGFTSDCLILDEAMDIPEATHAALLPTLSARPNPQVWYTGSAVDQEVDDNGVVFARIRERGHTGTDPSLAYFEWSAVDSIKDIDISVTADQAAWARANPALGIRISAEHVGRERASMSTRKFGVERLGAGDWPRTDEMALKIIDPAHWYGCVDPTSKPKNPVCFAFDVTPDRSSACIAVSGDREDGLPHIEVVDYRRGTNWVAERLESLKKTHKPSAILCDGRGPAGSLLPDIEKLGIEVTTVNASEHGQACGILYDAVMDTHTLRHLGTPELNAAVDGAATRPLGDAWAWSRKDSTIDISPLVACTLALWGNAQRPKHSKARFFSGGAQIQRQPTQDQPTGGPRGKPIWTIS